MTNNLITRIGVQVDDIYRRLQIVQDLIKNPLDFEKVCYYDDDIDDEADGYLHLGYRYDYNEKLAADKNQFKYKNLKKVDYGKLVDYTLKNNNLVVFLTQKAILLYEIIGLLKSDIKLLDTKFGENTIATTISSIMLAISDIVLSEATDETRKSQYDAIFTPNTGYEAVLNNLLENISKLSNTYEIASLVKRAMETVKLYIDNDGSIKTASERTTLEGFVGVFDNVFIAKDATDTYYEKRTPDEGDYILIWYEAKNIAGNGTIFNIIGQYGFTGNSLYYVIHNKSHADDILQQKYIDVIEKDPNEFVPLFD